METFGAFETVLTHGIFYAVRFYPSSICLIRQFKPSETYPLYNEATNNRLRVQLPPMRTPVYNLSVVDSLKNGRWLQEYYLHNAL